MLHEGSSNFGAIGNGISEQRFILKPKKIVLPFSTPIHKIASGHEHTILITKNFNAYSTGNNTYGQLGLGKIWCKATMSYVHLISKFTIVKFFTNKKIFDVFCGISHTIWRCKDVFYSCGKNDGGVLGRCEYKLKRNQNCSLRERMKELTNDNKLGYKVEKVDIIINEKLVNSVAVGLNYTIFLTHNGILYKTGKIFNEKENYIPKPVVELKGTFIINHSGGFQQYMCLSNTGKLYSIGHGANGELGHGNEKHLSTFSEVEFFSDKEIKQFLYGFHHALVLLKNGELWSFGNNGHGQLSNGHREHGLHYNTKPRKIFHKAKGIEQIFTGGTHNFFIDSTYNVWCVGQGDHIGMSTTKSFKRFTRNPFIPPLTPILFEENNFFANLKNSKSFLDLIIRIKT